LFRSASKLAAFAVLSKDAPTSLALAFEEEETGSGFTFVNMDLTAWPRLDLRRVYIPLGFAQDVEEWRERFGNALPEGHWVEFADLTRTMAEGGDGDRWFAAHFVGPMWWVVPPGSDDPPHVSVSKAGELVDARGLSPLQAIQASE
jgi:hypothetical protein